jgi:hypothetical protein
MLARLRRRWLRAERSDGAAHPGLNRSGANPGQPRALSTAESAAAAFCVLRKPRCDNSRRLPAGSRQHADACIRCTLAQQLLVSCLTTRAGRRDLAMLMMTDVRPSVMRDAGSRYDRTCNTAVARSRESRMHERNLRSSAHTKFSTINILQYTKFSIKRGSVPPRCPLGSAVFHQFFLRNGSN